MNKKLLAAAPVATALLLSMSAPTIAAGGPARDRHVHTDQIARTVTTSSGGRIVMPEGPVETVVTKYRIGPRAALPVHKHQYPRFGYVLSGALAVGQPGKGLFRIFKAGEFIAEDIDTWHEVRNLETRPVELLVIDLVPPGSDNIVNHQ